MPLPAIQPALLELVGASLQASGIELCTSGHPPEGEPAFLPLLDGRAVLASDRAAPIRGRSSGVCGLRRAGHSRNDRVSTEGFSDNALGIQAHTICHLLKAGRAFQVLYRGNGLRRGAGSDEIDDLQVRWNSGVTHSRDLYQHNPLSALRNRPLQASPFSLKRCRGDVPAHSLQRAARLSNDGALARALRNIKRTATRPTASPCA